MKYADIWTSQCINGLEDILIGEPRLKYPEIEEFDTLEEVLEYHKTIFEIIEESPLRDLKVISNESNIPQQPFRIKYDVDVFTENDELLISHQISTLNNHITFIEVKESNLDELTEKYGSNDIRDD